jgi:3-hydroxyisobutyrate dehydrogenase-like beta-hydroxyacid dehydrogenase
VVSAVPAKSSLAIAQRCASLAHQEALFVDLTSCSVADKQEGARLVAARGARYVDGAVLGTVAASGFEVPILACGSGAAAWKELAGSGGLVVDVIDAPAGEATRLKLLRSVYMKGRDALIVEMMLAARRYGLESRVAQSIAGPGEQVPFTTLADRVLRSLAVHARRRAEELEASSDVVGEAGVEPRMSAAGAEVLRRVAELGLRERFAGERPEHGDEALAAIELLRFGAEPSG